MDIKETCGFLDSSGKFHKTLKEAEDANVKIKIHHIERQLENFHTTLENLWYEGERHVYWVSTNHTNNHEVKQMFLEKLCKLVLQESDNFIEIIQEKKSLEKELEALRKIESYKNKWWVKYKWW